MKVIDAMTGAELRIGVPAPQNPGCVTLLQVRPGLFRASAQLRYAGTGSHDGDRWVPLQVRWAHPQYLLQCVGLVPS